MAELPPVFEQTSMRPFGHSTSKHLQGKQPCGGGLPDLVRSIQGKPAGWAGQRLLVLALGLALSGGCSLKRMALNKLGDALAQSGGTYGSDNDPELIREAAPFSLKLMESLLAENPRHRGLLLASASGFTQYAYAFLQQEADVIESEDLATAEALRDRARRLYLRARDYALRGLDSTYPNLSVVLRKNPRETLQITRATDVPLLYWAAASWGAAVSLSKDDPELISDQLMVEALIDRALELQEDFDRGAIHTFLISYEMARQGRPGDPAERARKHFVRAMDLSRGTLVAPLITYAEAVCVPKQDRVEFERLLNQALGLDPDAAPEVRLVNLILQRRAHWLLSRTEDLFLAQK